MCVNNFIKLYQMPPRATRASTAQNPELPNAPPIPRIQTLRPPIKAFDPEVEVYRNFAEGVSEEKAQEMLKTKCIQMHRDMMQLLQLIRTRYEIEQEYEKLEKELKHLDKKVQDMHRRLMNAYGT